MPKCILSYERSCFAVERRSNVLLCSRAEHVNTLDLQRQKEGRIGEKVFPQEKQRGSVRINVTALASSRKIILADYVGTPTRAWKRGLPLLLRKQRETLLCFKFLAN